ncbi:MAG: endonuclease/exonuclease/phosphatase family protein [Planctomycetota bacterium]
MNTTRWTIVFLLASVPLAILLVKRRSAESVAVTRFATFNVALNRPGPGELLRELTGGGSEQGKQLAEIVQRVQPDVLLLCELDRDDAGAAATVFAREYLGRPQAGLRAIEFPYVFCPPVNTGENSGHDLDGDGVSGRPGDAWGFGAFPGQYGMALLSRHPILLDQVRTFRLLPWSAMPDALQPPAMWSESQWRALRLSSKTHADVPIGIGNRIVHVLCSHPTPPVFDGAEDRNGCRNHDEIRFWVDYLTPDQAGWIVDDAGGKGGLAAGAAFVLLGDLNCDPQDGDARRQALHALLAHPAVQDPQPRSAGGDEQSKRQFGVNATHGGDPALDTGDFDDTHGAGPGNLRVDYVLPAKALKLGRSGVFWPAERESGARLVGASDHRLVWVDVVEGT